MKDRKIITAKIILILFGTAFLIYGLLLLAIIGTGSWFNFSFAAAGLLLIAIALLLKKILKAAAACSRKVLIVFCSVIALLLLNFVLFEGTVISMAAKETELSEAPDYIIVLGAKVDENNQPSLEFSKRLIKAEELCTDKSILILTGGKGEDEPVSEAEGAYGYLVKRGKLSAKKIFLEKKSTATSENLKYALDIIKENGGSSDDSVLIISSAFHLFRASKLAELAGFTDTSYAGSTGLLILQPYYYFREYAAYFREFVL